MELSNIILGTNVVVHPTSSINNVKLLDGVKIAKQCSLFGSKDNILEIGENTYVGMHTIINGFKDKIIIGNHVSIAQSVNIMSDSGPNASKEMQKFFPLTHGSINIGNHCWIGANSIIMPTSVLSRLIAM